MDGLTAEFAPYCGIKIARAYFRQAFIPHSNIFNLCQLIKIRKGKLTGRDLFQNVLVKLHHLHPAADSSNRKTGLFRNLFHGAAKVKHHLEALRLLVNSQFGTLHIFQKHGLHLFLNRHLRNHTRNLRQPGQLRSSKAAVADHNGELFKIIVNRNHGQILKNTVCPDAVRQLGQVAKVFPGIVRVRMQAAHRQIRHKPVNRTGGRMRMFIDFFHIMAPFDISPGCSFLPKACGNAKHHEST